MGIINEFENVNKNENENKIDNKDENKNEDKNENEIKKEDKNEDNNFEQEFISKNIDLKLLSQEEQNKIYNIPYVDFTYICIYCGKIPQLGIKYDENEGNIKALHLNECGTEIKLDNNNNFGLKKTPLETLYKTNFMNINNINNSKILKNENKLPFETINELNEYLKVYKSYLNIRGEIKKYNFGETKNNELFSLFEELLQIGLYGFGTLNEYNNSIIIKEFLMEKFKKFNKIQVLNNGLKLFRLNYVTFKKTVNITHLKDNIIALNYHTKHYNNKFFFLKYNIINDNFFESNINIYHKYLTFNSYQDIPIEYRKNFILCIESTDFKKIFYFGKNQYLVQPEDEKILYKFYFHEEIKEYFYETFNINVEEYVANTFVLDNYDIVVITFSHVYIFRIDYSSNLLICIKKFFDLNTPNQKPTLLKMNNGNFIINFPQKIICFSQSYEIISIFKNPDIYPQFSDMSKLSNENIIFRNMGKSYLLNVNKFNFSSFTNIPESVSFGINDNIIGRIEGENLSLYDYKLNKLIYTESLGESYYWKDSRFILLDESKKIFGFFSIHSNIIMKIFQIKN